MNSWLFNIELVIVAYCTR